MAAPPSKDTAARRPDPSMRNASALPGRHPSRSMISWTMALRSGESCAFPGHTGGRPVQHRPGHHAARRRAARRVAHVEARGGERQGVPRLLAPDLQDRRPRGRLGHREPHVGVGDGGSPRDPDRGEAEAHLLRARRGRAELEHEPAHEHGPGGDELLGVVSARHEVMLRVAHRHRAVAHALVGVRAVGGVSVRVGALRQDLVDAEQGVAAARGEHHRHDRREGEDQYSESLQHGLPPLTRRFGARAPRGRSERRRRSAAAAAAVASPMSWDVESGPTPPRKASARRTSSPARSTP